MNIFKSDYAKTNPKHTRQVKSGGRTFTAINATAQIKNATEAWGNYGESGAPGVL